MKQKQILFFSLALFYGLIHLVNILWGISLPPASAVIPGWHVELGYSNIYQKTFTVPYFLLVCLIYGAHPFKLLHPGISWLHFICSIIPAFSILLWPVFFSSSFNSIEQLDLEYKTSFYIEEFFIWSQLIFVLYFFYYQLKFRNRPTG